MPPFLLYINWINPGELKACLEQSSRYTFLIETRMGLAACFWVRHKLPGIRYRKKRKAAKEKEGQKWSAGNARVFLAAFYTRHLRPEINHLALFVYARWGIKQFKSNFSADRRHLGPISRDIQEFERMSLLMKTHFEGIRLWKQSRRRGYRKLLLKLSAD